MFGLLTIEGTTSTPGWFTIAHVDSGIEMGENNYGLLFLDFHSLKEIMLQYG